jgi:hypothetical protein
MLLSLCFMSQSSHAQAKYRCGNSFQDKPCVDGKGNMIGRQASAQQGQQASDAKEKVIIDTQCTKRGNDALKIIWKRDGGALQADLLANAHSGEQRELIGDVYANRGNAIDVRKKIESECMAAKESPLSRLKKMQQDSKISNDIDTQAQRKELDVSTNSDELNGMKAEKIKLQKCESIKSQLIVLKHEMRAGGDAQSMDSMNSQRRALDKELRTLNCL